MSKLKIAVLMGGNSSEREVSLSSGRTVVANLDKQKYEVLPVDLPSGLDDMVKWKPDFALIILHGRGGEDGQIQGYLETMGIKYSGCGVLASAVGMDKMIFRWVMERYGLPMAKLTNKVPCVVKPVDGGSSVGVTIVKKQEKLVEAIKWAKKYSNEVLVEEYLEGIELSCGVMGNEIVTALPVIEIRPKKDFFDYEAKYTAGFSEEICPAKISDSLKNKVQEMAVEVFKAIKGRGYARVDFIVHEGKPYILEINTLPGMTPNSLLPQEAREVGMSYSELLDKIIDLGRE
jgi:D-alanine-D-alanine ligase